MWFNDDLEKDCRTTLKLSPCDHSRKVPFLAMLPREGTQIGENGVERKRKLSRVEVMARVKAGSLRLKEAAELLELSYRQVKRVRARYREVGRGLYSAAIAGGGRIGRTRRSSVRPCWIGCESAMRISDRRWRANTWPAMTG